eukprot:10213430-Heterocapsa_arctica.AAC.1
MTVLRGPENKHGRRVRNTYQTIKVLKEEWMKLPPASCYQKLAQKDPMKAGALHTILADGVWTRRRAHKREKNRNGDCLLCRGKNAG